MKTDNEKLKEFLSELDEDIVVADGLAHAFVGLVMTKNGNVAVYSTEAIIINLMEKDMMDFQTAEEYMELNILNAYEGERTPLFLNLIPQEFWI